MKRGKGARLKMGMEARNVNALGLGVRRERKDEGWGMQ